VSCSPCASFDLLFLLKFVLALVCANPSCDFNECVAISSSISYLPAL
jgi:hypothetical protein